MGQPPPHYWPSPGDITTHQLVPPVPTHPEQTGRRGQRKVSYRNQHGCLYAHCTDYIFVINENGVCLLCQNYQKHKKNARNNTYNDQSLWVSMTSSLYGGRGHLPSMHCSFIYGDRGRGWKYSFCFTYLGFLWPLHFRGVGGWGLEGIFLELIVHLFRDIGEEDEKTGFHPNSWQMTEVFWTFRPTVLPPWVAGLGSRKAKNALSFNCPF
jgi:hypothetical protein